MDFLTMNIDDIIKWCTANNQVEWLKATANSTTSYKAYPRIKVKTTEGKIISKVDKTQQPEIKQHPITFIELKTKFVEKFMPELAPKAKDKKPSFHDKIKNL